MRALERFMLLQIIDERWREHLHDMDYLREGIHLRSFAQIDPLVAYKNEGFEMFTGLMNAIWEEFARYVFNVDVKVEGQAGPSGPEPRQPAWAMGGSTTSTAGLSYDGGHAEAGQAAIAAAASAAAPAGGVPAAVQDAADFAAEETLLPQPIETRRLDEHEKIGRNDPCWCGSGKKFKKCHGA
jgi:preprotein translocase subunit SecA